MSRKSSLTLQIIAATLAIGTMSSVLADDTITTFSPYWYMGGSVVPGSSGITTGTETLTDAKTHVTYTGPTEVNGQTDLGWGLFTGYRASQHFAMEFSFYDLGKSTYDYTQNVDPNQGTPFTITGHGIHHNYGVTLTGLVILPVSTTPLSVYARAGVGDMINTESSDDSAPGNFVAYDRGHGNHTTLVTGFGAEYDFSAHFLARADYIIFDANSLTNELGWGTPTFSLSYKF